MTAWESRMTAPLHRSVCQFTGEQRPSRFFEANAAADDRLAELERLRVENADLRTNVADLREALENRNAVLRRLYGQVVAASEQRDVARATLVGLGVAR